MPKIANVCIKYQQVQKHLSQQAGNGLVEHFYGPGCSKGKILSRIKILVLTVGEVISYFSLL